MNEVLWTIGSITLRAAVIYLALLVLLRIGGRRELAQLTPADMLLLLLLSESVSPSLTGGHQSLWTGLLSASVLILLTALIGWITFRSRRFEGLVEGNSIVLVREGRLDGQQLRDLRITDQQLRTFLHEHGLTRVDQVAVAYVEPSGKVTMVKEDEKPEPKWREAAERKAMSGKRTGRAGVTDAVASLAAIRAQLAALEQALARRGGTGELEELPETDEPGPLGRRGERGDRGDRGERRGVRGMGGVGGVGGVGGMNGGKA